MTDDTLLPLTMDQLAAASAGMLLVISPTHRTSPMTTGRVEDSGALYTLSGFICLCRHRACLLGVDLRA